MHLMLHIFKKDARRVWWAIAVALLLQACLVYVYASSSDATAVSLSLLLPMAWACLIALAVHEDPLVGDRQFWISRPIRWPVLLGSKLLFAAVCVHAPSFLADIAILALRGFHPWEWIPQLLEKQVMLAAALTLPVIALAAVLQSFAQLVLAAIAIVGATVYLSGFTPSLKSQLRLGVEDTRAVVCLAVLALAAVVMILMQFARRGTWRSRSVGIAAVAIAELVLIWMSPVFLARIRAVVHSTHTEIAFHLYPRRPVEALGGWSDAGWIGVAVPVAVSGIPKGVLSFFDLAAIDIIAPGSRYHETSIRPENGTGAPSDVEPYYIGPDWLLLHIRRSLYDRLKDARVELKATVVAVLHRAGETRRLPVGANQAVAGAGRCSSEVVERPGHNGEGLRLLRVVCESPAGFPLAPVTGVFGYSSGAPGNGLGELFSPSQTLLSPLARVQTNLRFDWLPIDVLSNRKLEITPDILKGGQVGDFDLHDIRLGDSGAR